MTKRIEGKFGPYEIDDYPGHLRGAVFPILVGTIWCAAIAVVTNIIGRDVIMFIGVLFVFAIVCLAFCWLVGVVLIESTRSIWRKFRA